MLRHSAGIIREHPLILSLYVPHALLGIAFGMMIPTLPFYAEEFDVSFGMIGLILAGQSIGMLLGDAPAGTLPRRFGLKTTLLAGIGLLLVATVTLFWVQSIIIVLLLRLISGMGRAFYGVGQHTALAETISNDHMGRSISLYGGIFRIGGFTGPLFGGLVAATFGVRSVFLIFAILAAFSFIFVLLFMQSDEQRKSKRDRMKADEDSESLLTTLQKNWRILSVAGTAQVFAMMARAGRGAIVPLYAGTILGLDVQTVGLIVSISIGIDMIMFYPAGIIMDRWGRKFAIVPCFTIVGIGMFLIPFTTDFWSLLLVTCLIGFGNGLGSGTMMTLSADLAPANARGEFLGLWRVIGDIGVACGPLAVGIIADVLILQQAPVALAISSLTATGIFLFFVPETLKRRPKPKPKH